MATFVIVHGAWSGPHAWRRVRPLLRAAGHEVVDAVASPGSGERAHLATPTTDLDTHVTDVAAVLHFEDLHDVVLVGHSYGGMVITGVADRAPERIAQLVYLDADVPRDGSRSWTWCRRTNAPGYEEAARTRGDGWRVPPPFPDPLPPGLPPEVVWAIERMVPMPLSTMTQPLHLAEPGAGPPAHLRPVHRGQGRRAPPPFLERLRADSVLALRRAAALGHTAHVTAPRSSTRGRCSTSRRYERLR